MICLKFNKKSKFKDHHQQKNQKLISKKQVAALLKCLKNLREKEKGQSEFNNFRKQDNFTTV